MAMEESILKSIKKVLSISEQDDSFDQDVLMHINSVLADLYQLGVVAPFVVEDDQKKWDDLGLDAHLLSMTKTYIYLKTRLLFDPPTTSFLLEAMQKQIDEQAWRMNVFREEALHPFSDLVIVEEEVV